MSAERRRAYVNGILVIDRPLCEPGKHEISVYHGYCVVCGLDSWGFEYRHCSIEQPWWYQ